MPQIPDLLNGADYIALNICRTGDGWQAFAAALRAVDVELSESISARGAYATDAGGTSYGLPHGVVLARSASCREG